MRIDQYLFDNQMVQSRERGRALIMEGLVYINGEKAEKAGLAVPEGANVEIRGNDLAYVSRGGLKLEKAMAVFPIALQGLVCMDVGASTGGFTDCMLQNGAEKVYAVDVGYGQLAWKLRCDERVVVMERTNARNLVREDLPQPIDFFSIDVSFISLKLILPAMHNLSKDSTQGVCLIKPQFEAGRDKVGKNGVVRDEAIHKEVIANCMEYACQNGFSVLGLAYSPIKGPKGNIEFLMYVKADAAPQVLDAAHIQAVCDDAHRDLTNTDL